MGHASLEPSIQPFNFIDLPTEIRLTIYHHYYGELETHLRIDSYRYKIRHSPGFELEQACRLIHEEAKSLRKTLPVTLIIADEARYPDSSDLEHAAILDCFSNNQAILTQTTSLIIQHTTISCRAVPWPNLADVFPRLQQVEFCIDAELHPSHLLRESFVEDFCAGSLDEEQFGLIDRSKLTRVASLLETGYESVTKVEAVISTSCLAFFHQGPRSAEAMLRVDVSPCGLRTIERWCRVKESGMTGRWLHEEEAPRLGK